ncbi:MAG: hypothetical protein MUF80_07785 [Burkholderiales bacterium]|nr:hypothetical protein [Burkholderiales bacterium]
MMDTGYDRNGLEAIRQRPYVTARSASELLGVPYTDVIDDIRDGMAGALPALIGAESGGTWYVAAFEVEGERLEMHRARLRAAGDSAVVAP